MPFEKGKVGNPLGKNSEKFQHRRIAAELLTPHLKTAVAEILNQLVNASEASDRQWATEMIMNYVVGKPTQAVELGDPDGNALSISVNVIKK